MTIRKKAKASAKKKTGTSGKAAAKKGSSPIRKKTASPSVRKKTAKRTAPGKTARKTAARSRDTAVERVLTKEPLLVEPGPPSGSIPPVEEPAPREEAVAVVTHYYSHLGVAVVQVSRGSIRTGDRVRIRGHSTDFIQEIGSMEYEHHNVDQADAGQSVGIKVFDHAREHDIVYLVK